MNLRIVVTTLCLGGALVFSATEASAFGFGRLGGGCCEPACGCEPACCVAEPSCGCDPCCDPCCEPRRCRLLDGLKGLFHRHRGGCCEPSCCCEEPSCCCEEPSCCATDTCCGSSSYDAGVPTSAPAPVEVSEEAAPMPPAPASDPNASVGRQRDVVRASFSR